jgi:hypothetical protein
VIGRCLDAEVDGEISIGRFAQYLGISRSRAMRFVEQEDFGGEEVEISAA